MIWIFNEESIDLIHSICDHISADRILKIIVAMFIRQSGKANTGLYGNKSSRPGYFADAEPIFPLIFTPPISALGIQNR